MINEHDITKSMIDKMRTIIRENVDTTIQQDIESKSQQNQEQPEIKEIQILKNGEIQPLKTGMDTYFNTEKEQFTQSVTPNVKFMDFTITPPTNLYGGDVLLSGKLTGNDVDIDFTMTKDETDGIRLTMNNSQLNSDSMELFKKLNGYYESWQKNWAEKLNSNEFKNL